MEWLRKFFSEPSTLAVLVTSAVIGFVVGVANGLIQRRHNGWSGFFQAMVTGVAVAVIVGLGLKDYVTSETARLAIIGACTVISDDIWAGLRAFGRLVREDPLGSVARVIDAFRGKGSQSLPPAPPKPSEE